MGMRTYYTSKRARSYDQHWKVFSAKTHAATCSVIDFIELEKICHTREQPARILDAACGTGLLLQQFAHRIPCAELYGVDASEDMLAQARHTFREQAQVQFIRASLHAGTTAGLPYEARSFDLISCTNALHNMENPQGVLRGLAELLVPQGQVVIEDFARRTFPFPWRIFEWFTRRRDPQHVRAYTLAEAQQFCQGAGLSVLAAKNFPIDSVWHGWVIRAQEAKAHLPLVQKKGSLLSDEQGAQEE
jgi:ubiquinone/menaquinone biosynthesis C-methylase UbiE